MPKCLKVPRLLAHEQFGACVVEDRPTEPGQLRGQEVDGVCVTTTRLPWYFLIRLLRSRRNASAWGVLGSASNPCPAHRVGRVHQIMDVEHREVHSLRCPALSVPQGRVCPLDGLFEQQM